MAVNYWIGFCTWNWELVNYSIKLNKTNVTFMPGGGEHLHFGLDIILVKGLSKHTWSMCFPSMKIYPNYAFLHVFFFLNFSIVSFPKFVKMTHNTPVFFNFGWFCTPQRCTHVHRLVLKNNPNYVIFFLGGWYPTSNTSAPPRAFYVREILMDSLSVVCKGSWA